MHRNDYALIGIGVVASLLILIPLGIGLADAQVFDTTVTITNSTGTFEVPAFTNATGTFPYYDYVEPESVVESDLSLYPTLSTEPEPVVVPTGTLSIQTYTPPTFPDEYYLHDDLYRQLAKRTTIGSNYNLVEDWKNGEATWTSTIAKIQDGFTQREDGTGVPIYKNYVMEQSGQKVIFNSNSIGGLVYDLPTCSYSIKENGYNGQTVVPSVSAVATGLVNGEWTNLQVNDALCDVRVTSDADGIVITSTKSVQLDPITVINAINGTSTQVPQSERFTQVLEVDSKSGIKETWKVWKTDDTPLGISQTVHTGAQIEIAGQIINIEALNGQSFDRQYIVDNEAEILAITDSVNYDFDEGIDSLTGVNIIHDSDYKVNLDYASGDFVGYLEIDPTFTALRDSGRQIGDTTSGTDCGTGNWEITPNTASNIKLWGTGDAGIHDCMMQAHQWDVSSLPTNTPITVSYEIEVTSVNNPRTCEINPITDFSATTANLFTDIQNGTPYASGLTECQSVGTHTIALNSDALTDLTSALSGTGLFSLGWAYEDMTTTSTEMYTYANLPNLIITYQIPAVYADPPTSVTATNGLPIGLTWTAPTFLGSDVDGNTYSSLTGYSIARTQTANSLVELPDNSGTNANLDFTNNEFLTHGFESVTTTNNDQSLEFDGSNDYVDVPNLNTGYDFSASMWVKMDTSGRMAFLVENGVGTGVWLEDAFSSGYGLRVGHSLTGGDFNTNTGIPIDGEFHHVVFNVATPNEIWVDGVSIGTGGTAQSSSTTFSPNMGVSLPTSGSGVNWLDGALDDVAIYDRILTNAEVISLYSGTDPTTISGLLAYYDMETVTSSTVSDSSSNNQDATNNGAVALDTTTSTTTTTLPDKSTNNISVNLESLPLHSNLNHYYKFDESSGTITDSCSTINTSCVDQDSTTETGVSYGVTGVKDSAIDTSSAGSQVLFPTDLISVNDYSTGSASVNMWVRATSSDSLTTNQYPFGQGCNTSTDRNFCFYWRASTNDGGFPYFVDSSGAVSTSFNEDLNDGNWHMMTGVVDHVNKEVRGYHNGVLYGTSSFTSLSFNPTADWTIGNYGDSGTANDYDGYLDEFTIYENYALTSNDITDLYELGWHTLINESTTGVISTGIQNPDLTFTDSNLPDNTDDFSIGSWVKLDTTGTITNELTIGTPYNTHSAGWDGRIYFSELSDLPNVGDIVTGAKVYVGTANGAVRLGLYSDNNGLPQNLLAETASVTLSSTGWLEIDFITPYTTTSTDKLHLGLQVSTGNESLGYVSTGITNSRAYMTYSSYTTFPSTASSLTEDNFAGDFRAVVERQAPPTNTKLLGLNDVTFNVGTTSASVVELATAPSYSTNFGTSTGWTVTDSEISVDTANNRIYYNGDLDTTDTSAYYDYYTSQGANLQTWTVDIDITKISNNNLSHRTEFLITDTLGGVGVAQNAIGITTGANNSMYCRVYDGTTTPIDIGSHSTNNGVTKYVRLSYDGTTFTCDLMDSLRTSVSSSHSQAISGVDMSNARYIIISDRDDASSSVNNVVVEYENLAVTPTNIVESTIISATGLADNTSEAKNYVFTRSGNNWEIYQNGVSKATATDTTSLGSNTGVDYTVNLDGMIDEYFINSDSLTSTEVNNVATRDVDAWSLLANPNDYPLLQTPLPDGSVVESGSTGEEIDFTNNEFLTHGFETGIIPDKSTNNISITVNSGTSTTGVLDTGIQDPTLTFTDSNLPDNTDDLSVGSWVKGVNYVMTPDNIVIDWDGEAYNNQQSLSVDLGTTLSNTNWVLRFTNEITAISATGGTGGNWIFFGLTDTDTPATNAQDGIGLLAIDDHGSTAHDDFRAVSADNTVLIYAPAANRVESTGIYASNLSTGTYNTEITRTGATTFTVKIYDSTWTNVLDTINGVGASSTLENLRYFKVDSSSSGFVAGSAPFTGKITNVQLWDGVTSASGTPENFNSLGTPVGSSISFGTGNALGVQVPAETELLKLNDVTFNVGTTSADVTETVTTTSTGSFWGTVTTNDIAEASFNGASWEPYTPNTNYESNPSATISNNDKIRFNIPAHSGWMHSGWKNYDLGSILNQQDSWTLDYKLGTAGNYEGSLVKIFFDDGQQLACQLYSSSAVYFYPSVTAGSNTNQVTISGTGGTQNCSIQRNGNTYTASGASYGVGSVSDTITADIDYVVVMNSRYGYASTGGQYIEMTNLYITNYAQVSYNTIISATSLTDNTSDPQHYAFTRSGNDWTIYQNGASVATAIDTVSLGSNTGVDYTVNLDGMIDEYFINSDALTSSEILGIDKRADIPSPVTTTSTSFNDNTVLTGNEYFYKVYSVTPDGYGTASNIDGAQTVNPANAPTGLTASVNSNAHIILNWTPSTDLGNGSLISMNIQRDDGSGWQTIATTSNTSPPYTDTTVTTSQTYDYRVASVNEAGVGAYSNTVTATAGIPADAIIDLSGSIPDPNNNPQEVQLIFNEPPNWGTGAPLSYEIYESPSGLPNTWTQVANPNYIAGQFTTTVNISSLSPLTDYYYMVRAVSTHGISQDSNIISVTTPNIPDQVPSVIASIDDPDNDPLNIHVTFVQPNNGGSNIKGYLIERHDDVSNTWSTLVANTANTLTDYQDTTVQPDISYKYRVSAINPLGTGATSPESNIVLTPTIPDSPTGLTVTTLSDTQLQLDYIAPVFDGRSALQGYTIEVESPLGSNTWVQVASTPNTTYTYTGLIATEYNFRVIAYNNVGSSNPSNTVSGWTLPSAPANLVANAISSGDTLELEWDQPTGTVVEYRVQRALMGATNWSTSQTVSFATACSGAVCTVQDTGLSSGTEFQFRIVAVNLGGDSDYSNIASNWTIPSPPSNLSLSTTPNTSTTVTLNWSAPSGTTTGYQIERESPIGGGWSVLVADTGSTLTTYDDTNLPLSTEFNYRVSAINLGGVSLPSNEADITTLSPPTKPLDIVFDLQKISENLRVQVSWTAPVNLFGGVLSNYMVERNVDGAGWNFLTNTGTTPSFVDTDIQRGVNYEYRVSATTQIGTGSPSISNSLEFVDGTFNLPLTAIEGNTLESLSSFTKTTGDPVSYATNILIVRHDTSNSVITTVASDNNLINTNSSAIVNGNPVGIELTSGTTQLESQYVYETSEFTYTGYLTTVQDGVTHIFTSANVTVAPLNPFGGSVFANEFRDELTYQTSTVELYAEPAGYDAVIRYQHQDPNIEPFFYAFENIQANNTSISPVLDDKDFYVSVYINPEEFDFEIVNSTSGLAEIKCNEDSPLNCPAWDAVYTPSGEITYSLNPTYGAIEDIPDGIQSDFVTKSFKSPDAPQSFGLEPLGDLFGMPMVFIFVIALGAVFTGRSAQMGVIFIAVTIGIMIYMGYLSFDFGTSGLSTAVTWGIIIVSMIGGILVGKRWS